MSGESIRMRDERAGLARATFAVLSGPSPAPRSRSGCLWSLSGLGFERCRSKRAVEFRSPATIPPMFEFTTINETTRAPDRDVTGSRPMCIDGEPADGHPRHRLPERPRRDVGGEWTASGGTE
jgi:hypothetical protein